MIFNLHPLFFKLLNSLDDLSFRVRDNIIPLTFRVFPFRVERIFILARATDVSRSALYDA